jgi:hypothetical protein
MSRKERIMSTVSQTTSSTKNINLRTLLISIALNAGIPFLLYRFALRYLSASEVVALSVAALFPAIHSIVGIVRHRRVDIIAVLVFAGLLVSIVLGSLTDNPKILLMRESFITGTLGVMCFVSLLFPKPLMFYFGRQFTAGNDPVKVAAFNATWQYPHARFVHRLITVVWGVAFVGEFLLRVLLVYTLPAATVLAVAPKVLTLSGLASTANTSNGRCKYEYCYRNKWPLQNLSSSTWLTDHCCG